MKRKSTKTTDIQKINPYTSNMTPQQTAELRAKLAKRANQRLLRLERSHSLVTGESYTFGAYKHYAADVLKSERPRWSESKRVDKLQTMYHDIVQIQAFLNAKTSTVVGNIDVEQLRIKTFESGKWGRNNSNGTKVFASNAEFYEFLNSGILSKSIQNYFTSEQMIEFYQLAIEKGRSHESIVEDMFNAISEFKNKSRYPSIEEMTKELGIVWEPK